MTPEVKRINDELAKTLGLKWHTIHDCPDSHRDEWRYCNPIEHGIPDLTSAEGHLLLEKTLLERALIEYYWSDENEITCRVTKHSTPTSDGPTKEACDPDLAIALVKAGHKLLVKE